jgi:hypothetical protein
MLDNLFIQILTSLYIVINIFFIIIYYISKWVNKLENEHEQFILKRYHVLLYVVFPIFSILVLLINILVKLLCFIWEMFLVILGTVSKILWDWLNQPIIKNK